VKQMNKQKLATVKPSLLVALCFGLCLMVSSHAMAQTKSAKGINAASSSIGAVLPELGNLESEILETVTLMEDMEECGQDSRFFDPVAGNCRTTDPVEVSFSQDASDTTVTIQRPDGSSINYSLDGEDGVATIVSPDPETPSDPEPPVSPPPSTPSSCSTPWGGTVAHNRTVTAYQTSSVACGSACQSQTRRCNDGSLSGTYRYGRCDIGECATGDWVMISRRVDADVGCGEIALPDIDCFGMPNPTGSCNVGERTTVCRNLIGNFKCMQAVYECQ